MKKSIFTTALLITSLLFVGCNNAQTDNTDNQIQSVNSEVDSVNEDRTDNSSSTSTNKNYNETKKPEKNESQTIKAGKGQTKIENNGVFYIWGFKLQFIKKKC